MPRSRRSDVSDLKAPDLGCQPLSEVRRCPPAARARSDGPARSGQRRAPGPRDLRSRLRRRQHHAHPGRALSRAAGHRRRFLRGDAGQGAQPDGRQARELHQGRSRGVQAGRAAGHPLQQRRLPVGREPHRLLPRPAEAAAVGRAARHPDAAQPRGALARADEEGGRDGPVARQARQGGRHPHRVGAGALLRRAEAACARISKSGNRSTSSR